MRAQLASATRAGIGATMLATAVAATAPAEVATPLLLVSGVGWTFAHNIAAGTSPVDGALLLDGNGASLVSLFQNVAPATLLAPFHLVAGPGLAPALGIVACLFASSVGYALFGAQRGLAGVGALAGASVTVLAALCTGRLGDGLGGLAAAWLVLLGAGEDAPWGRRLARSTALAACAWIAPWPTAGVLVAAGRGRLAALAALLAVAAPALGTLGHPSTPGTLGVQSLFWPAALPATLGPGVLPVSMLSWALVVALLGTRGWRGWGLGLAAAALAGFSAPAVDGRVLAGLPLPLGEGLAVAAAAAAPVVGIRFLAARGRQQVRALVALALVAELLVLRWAGQLPGLPGVADWPQSAAMAALAEAPGRNALAVYPAGSPETVGWLPWHRQAVRGLPAGVATAAAAPSPGRAVAGPARRGALWVRPSPGEVSLLATELGKPSAVEAHLVLWVLP